MKLISTQDWINIFESYLNGKASTYKCLNCGITSLVFSEVSLDDDKWRFINAFCENCNIHKSVRVLKSKNENKAKK